MDSTQDIRDVRIDNENAKRRAAKHHMRKIGDGVLFGRQDGLTVAIDRSVRGLAARRAFNKQHGKVKILVKDGKPVV